MRHHTVYLPTPRRRTTTHVPFFVYDFLIDTLVFATRGANLIQVNTVPLWIESECISILFPFLLHFLTMATCCWLQIETNHLPQSWRPHSKWALHTCALQSASVDLKLSRRPMSIYSLYPTFRRLRVRHCSLNSTSWDSQEHILWCKCYK
jgi:hypothetical protein